MILLAYFLLYTLAAQLNNIALPHYCNYILGTYKGGLTQTLVSVIGGIPMGTASSPPGPSPSASAKNVTAAGFLVYAPGNFLCCLVPTNLPLFPGGQFIKNIGGFPVPTSSWPFSPRPSTTTRKGRCANGPSRRCPASR